MELNVQMEEIVMVIIEQTKCIGCGFCIKDCFPNNLMLKDGKATTIHNSCMQCGHCIAVCPANAIYINDYDMDNITELSKDSQIISPESLMYLIKSRRSIRHFKEKSIEKEKIRNIIEAGRYTPTGGNLQDISYVVVEEKMQEFRSLAINSLGNLSDNILKNKENTPLLRYYAKRWKEIHNKYMDDPMNKDNLFFHAPTVILITGTSTLDIGLAASNMELMTYTQDLGMVYSGFITRACQQNTEIKEFLGIKEQHEVQACMVIGYPDVTYLRTVPRKKPEVQWL